MVVSHDQMLYLGNVKKRTCTKCGKSLLKDDFYDKEPGRKNTQCKRCVQVRVSARQKQLKREHKCFHCAESMESDDVTICKPCKAKRRAEYHADGDRRRAASKRYSKDLRLAAFEAYGGPVCACCGETQLEFLTIDHVNNDGAEHRREIKEELGYVPSIHRWLKRAGYPPGFQVLCWNCNCAKAHFGSCPHTAGGASLRVA